jgi:8-oxo-dGTP pyrophosphatase MutT (NUDIX family)
MAQTRHNIGIESPGFNAMVVRKDDDGWQFLLLRRAETETYSGTWGVISGRKHDGESMAQAVARETVDETGLTEIRMFATEHLIQYYEPENDKIWIMPLIVVAVPGESEVVLSEENDDFVWLLPHRALHRVTWKNLERAIKEVDDELELYPVRNWVEMKA